jgi:hypothetical protein
MLFTQLPAADTPHGEFTLHSFLHALRYYAELLAGDSEGFAPCGLLQLHGAGAAGSALGKRFAVPAAGALRRRRRRHAGRRPLAHGGLP